MELLVSLLIALSVAELQSICTIKDSSAETHIEESFEDKLRKAFIESLKGVDDGDAWKLAKDSRFELRFKEMIQTGGNPDKFEELKEAERNALKSEPRWSVAIWEKFMDVVATDGKLADYFNTYAAFYNSLQLGHLEESSEELKKEIYGLKEALKKQGEKINMLLDGLPNAPRPIQELVRDALLAEKDNRPKDAIDLWKQLELRRDIGDSGLCAVYLQLANLFNGISEYEDALYYGRKAEKIAKTIEGDEGKNFLAGAFNILGLASRETGDYPKAKEYHEKGLRISEELGDESDVAMALGNLGIVYQDMGELPKAEEHHKKALEIDEKIGNPLGMAQDLGNLGSVYFQMGDLPKAEEHHKKALEIDEKIGNPLGMAQDLGNLGSVYMLMGELPKAEEQFKKALEIYEKIDNPLGMANALGNLGLVYQGMGDLPKAEELFKRALEIDEKIGNPQGMASDLGNLGNVYIQMGELPKAEEYHKRALEIDEKIGNPQGMASDLGNLGNIYAMKEQFYEAEECYIKILAIFKDRGARQEYVLVSQNLAIVRLQKGDYTGAVEAAQAGIEVAEQLPHMSNKLEQLKQLLAIAEQKLAESRDENDSNQSQP